MKKLILFIIMLVLVVTLLGCTDPAQGDPQEEVINPNLIEDISEEIKDVLED